MDKDSAGSSSSIRVKRVEEINSTVNQSASTSGETGKRKLPDWMQSNSDSKDVKRNKTGNGQELKIKTENDLDSAVGSSSNIDGTSGNALQYSERQQEDQNIIQNNEINTSNEAASTNEPEDDINELIIKAEPEETCASNAGEASEGGNNEEVEVDESKVKIEDVEDSSEPASSSAVNSKADIKVVKVEVTSSTRDSCKFGVRCYRIRIRINTMGPDVQMPSTSRTPMETEDIVPSTSAIPFDVPHTTHIPKTKAQRQREYRKRKAAIRTPEEAAAFAKATAERQRRYQLRKTANLAPVAAERRVAQTNAQRQRAFRQRRAVQAALQPSTGIATNSGNIKYRKRTKH